MGIYISYHTLLRMYLVVTTLCCGVSLLCSHVTIVQPLLQLCYHVRCRIADIMNGKGGGKGGKFQGKCQKLENRGTVEQLLREMMDK